MGAMKEPTELETKVIRYLDEIYEDRPDDNYDTAKLLIRIIKHSSEVRNFYTWK